MIKYFCDKCKKEIGNSRYSVLIGQNRQSGSYELCEECVGEIELLINKNYYIKNN